jgi:hypothetical protein
MKVGFKTSVDTVEKYIVWHIEGGLGKNVAATALIENLSNKYPDRKLIMVVSYPEIFLNNPYVYRVYAVGNTMYFYDDYIKDKDTIIFRHEPYFQSDHITRKKHLIQNWCDLLGIEYSNQLPHLHPNALQKNMMYKWQREKPVMVIQTNGGPLNDETGYSWTRDIPYITALELTNRFKSQYHIIQICSPNSILLPDIEHIIQPISNFELFSILAVSDKRILIDSSLQHAAAGMGLPSTVLWIGTSPNNFGYKMHKNIIANEPDGNTKLVNSYFFDYSFNGEIIECPYNNMNKIFDLDTIIKNI